MAEEFVKALSQRVSKVLRERVGKYTLLLTEVSDSKIVMCFKEGATGVYYVKVMLERDLSSLNCREAEYSPHGLYAFSKNPVDLATKAYEKAMELVNRATSLGVLRDQ